jgi:hypothetical protein
MKFTYLNTAQVTPATATAIDAQAGANDNRVLKKILVGNPVSGGNIVIFNLNNAVFGATTNIAYKHTFPTFSATNTNGVTPIVIDFTGAGGPAKGTNGLILQGGGSVTTDQTMQVTLLWDNPDDEN